MPERRVVECWRGRVVSRQDAIPGMGEVDAKEIRLRETDDLYAVSGFRQGGVAIGFGADDSVGCVLQEKIAVTPGAQDVPDDGPAAQGGDHFRPDVQQVLERRKEKGVFCGGMDDAQAFPSRQSHHYFVEEPPPAAVGREEPRQLDIGIDQFPEVFVFRGVEQGRMNGGKAVADQEKGPSGVDFVLKDVKDGSARPYIQITGFGLDDFGNGSVDRLGKRPLPRPHDLRCRENWQTRVGFQLRPAADGDRIPDLGLEPCIRRPEFEATRFVLKDGDALVEIGEHLSLNFEGASGKFAFRQGVDLCQRAENAVRAADGG